MFFQEKERRKVNDMYDHFVLYLIYGFCFLILCLTFVDSKTLPNVLYQDFMFKQDAAFGFDAILKTYFPAFFALLMIFIIQFLSFWVYFFKNRLKRNKLFDSIKNIQDAKNRLTHEQFEDYIAYLYRKKGYDAIRVGFGNNNNIEKTNKDGLYGDGGKDVVLRRPFRRDVIIQCKLYSHNVGVSVIREMFATLIHYKASKVIIITTSNFSKDAVLFAKGKRMELINGKTLNRMITDENFMNKRKTYSFFAKHILRWLKRTF